MFQFHPSNPFRVSNWRWERARTVRESKGKIHRAFKDDPLCNLAYKFQVKLLSCKDDVDRWNVMEEYPDLYAAYLIHRRGDNEERHPMRYAIEARILAGQSDEEIAECFGISSDIIKYYEKVFFNVREKLNNSDYIMTCVIGPSVQAGLSDRDYDLLWKLFGYLYGPTVLNSFITTTSRRYRPETQNEIDAALADDTRSAIQRKVAVVARTFSINPFSQSELLNIYARFIEVEKDAGSDKGHDVILQNIQVMLDKLPFRGSDDDPTGNKKLLSYDSGGVELNTNELLATSLGYDIDSHKEIEELKFPEKKDGTAAK